MASNNKLNSSKPESKTIFKTNNLLKLELMLKKIISEIGEMYLIVKKKNFLMYELAFFISGFLYSFSFMNKLDTKKIDIAPVSDSVLILMILQIVLLIVSIISAFIMAFWVINSGKRLYYLIFVNSQLKKENIVLLDFLLLCSWMGGRIIAFTVNTLLFI